MQRLFSLGGCMLPHTPSPHFIQLEKKVTGRKHYLDTGTYSDASTPFIQKESTHFSSENVAFCSEN